MRAASHQARAVVTPPNFAAVAGKSLADLIHTLSVTKAAADQACTLHSQAEDASRTADGKLPYRVRPKVCGGITEGMTLIRSGQPIEIPGGEWFFSKREDIQKDGTPEQLAEWDRQVKAIDRAYPRKLAASERAMCRALDIWTRAERALTRYRPTSAAEAVELLTLAGKPQERGTLYLDIDQEGLQAIARNCAAALQKALAQ